MGRLLALIGAIAVGCAARGPETPRRAPAAAAGGRTADGAAESNSEAPLEWQTHTLSPRAVSERSPELSELGALCEGSDAALDRVAARLALRHVQAKPVLDVAEITFGLRVEGSPYVWPRAWTLEGPDPGHSRARERMQSWLRSFDDGGERRCGVAQAQGSNGRNVVVALAADVLAELTAFPIRARVGQWLEVEADLLVPATDAKVIVLGPFGVPRSVPTSLAGRRIHARFVADREGPWLVQLLAGVEGGPRPILEAMTFAGVAPDAAYASSEAPGEDLAGATKEPDAALERMINGARSSEGLGRLRRAAELDEIARQHAEAMRDAGRITHDFGQGNPNARVQGRGLHTRAVGENVAHASDVTRAHRALWRSPSHRENLLQPRFDAVGIGIAIGQDGSVWVCEVFADF